jgi:Phage Mu protein F like protein/Colicin E5 ribonuclease domain
MPLPDIIYTLAYRKAFELYIKRGTPIELSHKAFSQEHLTTHYIWRTRGDNKVRASHAANNGKIFAWESPPSTGHPGEDYGCRCWAEPYHGLVIYDPPIEPVYPEFLLLPLLRTLWLLNAWRLWVLGRRVNAEWRLGAHKSAKRWASQIENRRWTPEEITETIKNGEKFPAPNRINPHNPAARYEYNGRYIVRDEVTKEILQISGDNFKRPPLPE